MRIYFSKAAVRSDNVLCSECLAFLDTIVAEGGFPESLLIRTQQNKSGQGSNHPRLANSHNLA